MTETERRQIIALVKSEVIPAIGCTEPIAVALCVAKAAEVLNKRPEKITVLLSANILKNAMGVGIPGTGMIGLPIAVALGALIGKSAYQLEVLKDSTPDAVEAGKRFIEEKRINISLKDDIEEKLYIEVCCEADTDKATAIIAGGHTCFTYIMHNGDILLDKQTTSCIEEEEDVLLRNLELFGISNSFVTNEPPHVLAERFPEFFHKIMVDAPCSGEGMFRKNPAVADSWKEKGPEYFSKLQREIIVQAADMLLPGGMMFYSTCTFSPLENEKTITHLLKERPDMEVVPMEDYENFAEGLTSYKDEAFDESCKLCRRIWPHKMSGEGHFMALLHKKSGAEQEIKSDEQDSVMQNINYLQAENSKESGLNRTFHMNQEANTSEILNRDKKENTIKYQQDAEPVFDRKNIEISQKSDEKASKKSKKAKKKQQTETLSSVWWEKCKSLSKEQKAAAEDFFAHVNIAYDVGRIDVRGDNLYYLPEPQYDGRGLHFLRNGLFMGEFKKKRFEPSQPFALALRAQDFDQVLDFPADDERLQRYLRVHLCGACQSRQFP